MNCECSIEVRSNYLFIKVEGDYDEELILNLPRLIKEACTKNNKTLVLFYGLELKNISPTATSRYEIGLEIATELKNEVKLAVVWPLNAINYYSQTIAEMNGAQFKIFSSEDEAKAWLFK